MNFKKKLPILFLVLFLIINIFIVIVIYFKPLAPDDSSASNNAKLILNLSNPTSITNIANGAAITVALSAQNTTGAGVAEIIIMYDSTILTAQGMSEGNNLLALNKSISTPGKITVDLANGGPGDLPANTTLVTFTFTVINGNTSRTVVRLDPASTLGYPNMLSPADGLGNLTLVFKPSICGDGAVQTPNDSGVTEACDNGSQNGVACTAGYGLSCNYCNSTCTTLVTVPGPRCGDSIIQINEVCDNGPQNGMACTAAYGGTCNYCNNTCSASTNVTGPSCGDGIQQTNEACDDGNLANYDQCSNSCLNTCGAGQIWIGNKCTSKACLGDYDRNGVVGASDFGVFGQNYRKNGLRCDLDINITNGVCFLDVQDLGSFAGVYKNDTVCKFN